MQLDVRLQPLDQFGVLLPEATRDLDKRYFTIDRTNVHYKNIDGQPVRHDQSGMTGFPRSSMGLVYPERTKSLQMFLDRFGMPKVGSEIDFCARVNFGSKELYQKWIALEAVEFVEVYRGFGEMTIRVAEAGLTVSEGFDKYATTYGKRWCLDERKDQEDLALLIVRILKPYVVHCGTPCTTMCRIGNRVVTKAAKGQNMISLLIMEHQMIHGLGGSVENPHGLPTVLTSIVGQDLRGNQ